MKNNLIILLLSITTLTLAQNSIRLADIESNYLSIDNSDGAFYETGDFTFEMWIKIDAWDTGGYAGYKAGILSYNQSNFWLAIQSQGKPQLRMGCGDLSFNYTASDWVGNWKHIALVRVGETLNWYVDGQLSASKSCSGGKFMDTNIIKIGTNPGWTCSIDGWISKIRYVKGTAVYTSDFNPLFQDLENISGTELLLNVSNEADAFKDSSNSNHTINLHGSNANPYFVAGNGLTLPADILMNGTVSAENNQIKNVADPTDAQDAATKNYVDSNVNSFSGSYTDLTNTPTTITTQQASDITTNNAKVNFPGFGTSEGTALEGNTALFSGSYTDLTDKPTTYTQTEVDALETNLQAQIDNLKTYEIKAAQVKTNPGVDVLLFELGVLRFSWNSTHNTIQVKQSSTSEIHPNWFVSGVIRSGGSNGEYTPTERFIQKTGMIYGIGDDGGYNDRFTPIWNDGFTSEMSGSIALGGNYKNFEFYITPSGSSGDSQYNPVPTWNLRGQLDGYGQLTITCVHAKFNGTSGY